MSNERLKPRLTLRIGVTGHRPNRLPEAAALRVSADASRVLDDIRQAVERAHQRHGEAFSAVRPELVVVTSLAEGADRILAHAAIAKGEALASILPFTRDRYERDFEDPASVAEFRALLAASASVVEFSGLDGESDQHLAGAEAGYELSGLMTLRQCDLLIAVWDGGNPAGKGGTADVISSALDSDLPCIWISVDDASPPRILIPGVAVSGDLKGRIRTEEWSAAHLDTLIATLVSPPGLARNELHTGDKRLARDAGTRLRAFFAEHRRRFNPWFAFPALQTLLGVRRLSRGHAKDHASPDASEEWQAYWKRLAAVSGGHGEALRTVLYERYAFVDDQARYYAQAYRSAYILSFLLAAAAVAVAAAFLILGGGAWIAVEVGLIALLLLVSAAARGRHWHERWIDYRQLAELLRHLRILAITRSSVAEARSAHIDPWCDPGTQWINWYYRATIRELGFRTAVLDRTYARHLALMLRESELEEQVRYHTENARAMTAFDRRLDSGAFIFWSVAAVAAVAMAALTLGEVALGAFAPLALVVVVAPALGAAFYGIRMHGNYRGIAQRSHLVATRLRAIRKQVAHHLETDQDISFPAISYIAEQAAEIMLLEMSEWRTVFRGKPLVLPA